MLSPSTEPSDTEPTLAAGEMLSSSDSFPALAEHTTPQSDLYRRLTYMMAFRVLLITIVMGVTTLLYFLAEADLTQTNSVILYGIIGSTYVLTLVYTRILKRVTDYSVLASWQIVGDLLIATVIVHITGGAQSAYSFFFPLAVIGSAIVHSHRSAIIVTITAGILFVSISLLGWTEIIPSATGQRLLPYDLSALEFSRAVALNLAAIIGVGAMAIQLAAQLQKSSTALEIHRSAAADLLTLHENIVRCLTSGLITVDTKGCITTANETAAEILSCDTSSVGQPLGDFAPELTRLLREQPIEQAARRGEVTHKKGDLELILGVSISPLYDHKLHPIGRILNFQDLTEVRQLEEHMKRAERLAVIGTLAAGVAHEIRNPLASISGSIELLNGDSNGDEDSAALMNIVTREIERLDTLITELLDYANPRAAKRIKLDVCAVIRDTLRVFAQSSKFSEVEVHFADDGQRHLWLCADPEKIRQLIWNLLDNGAEAALAGLGHLWVTAELESNRVVLRFKDDGGGIPVEVLDKVFDPFFTTKAKGTGLGLATVHGTVTDHGGTIRVSNNASGAVFEVLFPESEEDKLSRG